MPIYSENHLKHMIRLLEEDKLKNLQLIVDNRILKSIQKNPQLNKGLLKNKKVKIKCISTNPKIFLTYADEFMSLTLFFKDGHYDDSQILIAKDKNALKWALGLHQHFDNYN